MRISFVRKCKQILQGLDIFELKNSVILYYVFMFIVLPLSVSLNVSSKAVEHIRADSIPTLDFRIALFLIIGLTSLLVGYTVLGARELSLKKYSIFRYHWDARRVLPMFIFLFTCGVIIKVIKIAKGGYFHLGRDPVFTTGPFYSAIEFLNSLGTIAMAIAFIYYFYLLGKGHSGYRLWRSVAWGSFAVEFLYGFFSGSKVAAIVPIITYLIVVHYMHHRSYLRVTIAALFILFILMPLMNFYNAPKAFYFYTRLSMEEHTTIDFKGVQQYVFDNSIARVDQSRTLAAIINKTNNFLYGRSLVDFFIILGPPRFMWTNKPVSVNASGNEFGHRLGLINMDDFVTSMAPTNIGEWYMNFGLVGIIGGMFLMGMFFRLIYKSLVHATSPSLSGILMYSVLWIGIIKGSENWIAPVYAGLVKLFALLLIINFFLRAKDQRESFSRTSIVGRTSPIDTGTRS